MIRPARAALLALVVSVLAAGCPDPETVGHAPKKQIDMTKERLDKASDKVNKELNEAAKIVDENK